MKGIFVGYSSSSKAYIIYIKEGHSIEVSKDAIFYENTAYKKSNDLPINFDDEELPIFEECPREEEDTIPNHEEEGPSELFQQVIILETRKRPTWLTSTLQEAKGRCS